MEKNKGLFSFRKHPVGNFPDGKKGRKRKGGRLRRSMGFLMAAVLIFNTLPASGLVVSASEQETGLCEHHPEHTAECGYTEEKNSEEAQDCGYVCETCNGTEPEDTENNAENDTEDAGTDTAECICEILCTEDNGNNSCRNNGDCPVCGADDASLLDCKGKVPEENTGEQEDTGICKHHQEHDADCGYIPKSEDGEGSPCTYKCRICPVEDLIADLPDKVTEDNAEEVRAQLDEILALYRELTEDEQEQIDLSRCYALQGALDNANAPMTGDGRAEQQETDEASVTIDGQILYYATLEEAFTAANGQTAIITMLADVEQTSTITINGGTFTLDMNGKEIRNQTEDCGPSLTVNGGELTVQDSAADGKITAAKSFGIYIIGGTVHLNGGTVTGTTGVHVSSGNLTVSGNATIIGTLFYGMNIMGGTVSLSGGTFESPDARNMIVPEGALKGLLSEDCAYFYNGLVPVQQSDLSGVQFPSWDYKSVTVKTCTHEGAEITDNGDGTHDINCPFCGYTATDEAHDWDENYVCTVCGVQAVAKVNDTCYTDFQSAWSAAQSAGTATVTLLADVTLPDEGDVAVAGQQSITLNSPDGEKFTLSGKNSYIIYVLGGSLNVEDVTVENTDTQYMGNSAIYVENIDSPQITIGKGATVTGRRGINQAGGTLTLTVSGTVEGTLAAGVGIFFNSGTLTVEEGAKISGGGYGNGINQQGGSLIINGGTISGGNGVSIYKGSVKLNGGTFTGTKEDGGAISMSSVSTQSLGDLLEIGWAILKADGTGVERTETSTGVGTFTVGTCDHKGVEATSNNNGTHVLNCPYCGHIDAAEDCTYTFTGTTGVCTACGDSVTVSVSGTDNLTYDGTGKEPEVTVTRDSTTLAADTDYTAAYTDNINAGTAKVIVTIGNNQGTYTGDFIIGHATPTVTWSDSTSKEMTYTGAPVTIAALTAPTVTLVNNENFNGTISYSYRKQGETGYTDGLPTDAGTYMIKAHVDAKGNYTSADSTNELMLTIKKADAEIMVGTAAYNVTYGDPPFAISGVTDTNPETGPQYAVPEGTDIVAVSNGTVAIRNAGTAIITVSLPETANYNAADSKVITVLVAKKDYTVDALDRSYFYLKENTDTIDLVGLLPKDCGTAAYGTPTTSGSVIWKAAGVDHDGKLSYTLAGGNIDDSGTITVAVQMQNYEDTMITVNVKLVSCDHVAGDDILYTGTGEMAPTCTEDGLGHRECIKCGFTVESGIVVKALGHNYNEGEVTKEPTALADGEKTYTCSRCGDTYTEPIPHTTPEGLWISGLAPSVTYTGSAMKPEGIRVYHGSTLLREKTEYTISYKNNTKAGTAQVIVTGKGSYTGKATAEFTIEAVDLSTDTNISAFIATAAATGKNLKPSVTVTWNGKKLKEKTDYTLTYEADIKTASAEGYDVTITGKGNYTGAIVRKFRVVSKGTPLLNSAKVTGLAKSYPYQQGKEFPDGLKADLEKLSVNIGKTTLAKDDYTVRVENGNVVGTGAVVLEAAQTGGYAGEKRILFNITGISLKKCYITGLEKTYPYTGSAVMPEIKIYTGRNGTGTEIPAEAYTVWYSNCMNQGKATVTVTGKASKGYSGSIKASYTIGRLNLAAEESAGNITVTMPADIKYAKGGAKPQPVITHTDKGTVNILREGVDYTLKYSSNTAAGGKTKPTLKITGTGNYCGTITKTFDIGAQDIGTLAITAADKAYSRNKKGSYYYSVPKVYDLDGKQLKQKTDYTVSYFDMSTGQEIDKNDIVANGAQIRVTVTAAEKSSYTGTLSTIYHVRDAKEVRDIAKARFDKIAPRQYTGSEIRPEVSLYMQTGKTKTYLTAEDYEIIGYYNNVKKGTATILIRGTNAYSGVKSITFKITAVDSQSIWSGIFS